MQARKNPRLFIYFNRPCGDFLFILNMDEVLVLSLPKGYSGGNDSIYNFSYHRPCGDFSWLLSCRKEEDRAYKQVYGAFT